MSEEEELKPLNKTDQATLAVYLKTWNGTRAWMSTHPKASYNSARVSATEWLAKPNIKAAIQSKLEELQMGADEAITRMSDVARSDIGVFFKTTDEWMFNPLPEYEILDEKEVIDETTIPPRKRISYRVRHVVLDMDKVKNPAYSWMLKSFSNSRKNGYKIELHDQYDALRDILKIHGKFVEKHEHTGKDGAPIEYTVKVENDDTDNNQQEDI